MAVTRTGPKEGGIMVEATIDPVVALAPEEPGPITADLGTIVTRAARRFGAKTALIAPGRTLTYQALDDLCDRVAGGLHDIGVRPGDRVSLYSPNRWEWVVAYHAALRAKMAEWERRADSPLLELWGMTELAGAGTSNCTYMPNVHGSIGFALPGVEARVAALDDPSVTVPDGEPGELMIRGPLVMLGYYGNEPATKAAIEPDGWMHTGDIGSRDDEGHYFIVDRKKDLIITGGFNVYPAEIERVVASHPAVAMVAVGSVPDETLGELARAYVVLRPGATATQAEIIEHCRPHLAAYKLPRSVRFAPDLPKTSTGKVMRRELKTLDR